MILVFGSFYGNKLNIESYEDSVVSLVNTDGVKFFVQVSPYLEAVKSYIGKSKWMECRAVCRDVKNEALWALLAGSAILAKQLDTAEECFLAIGQIERATFIQHIKVLINNFISYKHNIFIITDLTARDWTWLKVFEFELSLKVT